MYLREKIRTELYNELKTETMQQFFNKQRHKNPLLKPFTSPDTLIEFLHNRENPDYDQDDAILRSLIANHQTDNHSFWKPFLSIIFWPAIEGVFFRQRNQYMDDDDLFLEVYWAFCEVLRKYTVNRRRHKVAYGVKLDILHLICRSQKKYCQQYRISRLAIETAQLLHAQILSLTTPDITSLDRATEKEFTEQDYKKLLANKIITETDYFLLVGTKIYGRSLVELAREHNLTYEAAKKRKQRAERLINKLRIKRQKK